MARPKSIRPELIELAKALRFQDDGRKRPLHRIATKLAELGHLSHAGKPYVTSSVRQMLMVGQPTNPAPHPHCPVCHAARRPEAS
jgi:hypothetical protein